ncbi:MAG: hypothetical protein GKS03_06475 [Alphaproteobacteria bacterium]|nr:hypothetical protein [Alphaproteobacteria bacterium]
MAHQLTRLGISAALVLTLISCGEPEEISTLDVQIVDREDFTYSAGYGYGCKFKVQIVNNTKMNLTKLEAFIMDEDTFLFSVNAKLPSMGSSIRTHDVQQNKRCNEIGKDVKLKKNACSLGTMSEPECFEILQISPPDA